MTIQNCMGQPNGLVRRFVCIGMQDITVHQLKHATIRVRNRDSSSASRLAHLRNGLKNFATGSQGCSDHLIQSRSMSCTQCDATNLCGPLCLMKRQQVMVSPCSSEVDGLIMSCGDLQMPHRCIEMLRSG